MNSRRDMTEQLLKMALIPNQSINEHVVNSISVNDNDYIFEDNTDSGETARYELSHLRSALLAFIVHINIPKLLLHEIYFRRIINNEESTLGKSALKELNTGRKKHVQAFQITIIFTWVITVFQIRPFVHKSKSTTRDVQHHIVILT